MLAEHPVPAPTLPACAEFSPTPHSARRRPSGLPKRVPSAVEEGGVRYRSCRERASRWGVLTRACPRMSGIIVDALRINLYINKTYSYKNNATPRPSTRGAGCIQCQRALLLHPLRLTVADLRGAERARARGDGARDCTIRSLRGTNDAHPPRGWCERRNRAVACTFCAAAPRTGALPWRSRPGAWSRRGHGGDAPGAHRGPWVCAGRGSGQVDVPIAVVLGQPAPCVPGAVPRGNATTDHERMKRVVQGRTSFALGGFAIPTRSNDL